MSASDQELRRSPNLGGRRLRPILARVFFEYGVFWALVLIVVAAPFFYGAVFDGQNIKNILSQNAPVGIVAVGMTFVMIGGGFDLSVTGILALGAVIYAKWYDDLGLWGAGAIVIAVSLACGIVNGVIVTKIRVNPFVATLGSGSIFGGFAYIYTSSAPQTPNAFDFQTLGINSWFSLPIAIWIMGVIFVVGAVLLARTTYGRSVYSIGGNNEAARLAGLRVDVLRGSTYVLSALCAGIGGMILASRLGVGQADLGGTTALDAIAIVVIGGTSLLGGEGAVWRTGVGLLTIGILTNVLDSRAIDTNWQSVVKGSIIIAAVGLDVLGRSRK